MHLYMKHKAEKKEIKHSKHARVPLRIILKTQLVKYYSNPWF